VTVTRETPTAMPGRVKRPFSRNVARAPSAGTSR